MRQPASRPSIPDVEPARPAARLDRASLWAGRDAAAGRPSSIRPSRWNSAGPESRRPVSEFPAAHRSHAPTTALRAERRAPLEPADRRRGRRGPARRRCDVAAARHGRSAPRAGRRSDGAKPDRPVVVMVPPPASLPPPVLVVSGPRLEAVEAMPPSSRVHDGRRVQLRHVPNPSAARGPVSVSDRPPAVPRRAACGDGGGPAAAAQSARNRSPSARARAAAAGDQRHARATRSWTGRGRAATAGRASPRSRN